MSIGSTQGWQKDHSVIVKEEELEIFRTMVTETTTFSPTTEQLSTWFLGAAGAGIAIVVPKLDEAIKLLGNGPARICLGLLVASVFFGFVSKRLGMSVQFNRALFNVTAQLPKVYAEYSQYYERAANGRPFVRPRVNPETITANIMEAAPFYARWKMKRMQSRVESDPLFSYKRALNHFGWQNVCFDIQLSCVAATILVAVFFV